MNSRKTKQAQVPSANKQKMTTETKNLTKKFKTAQWALLHIMEPDFCIPHPTAMFLSIRLGNKPKPWMNIAQVWSASTADHMDLRRDWMF